jgi:hypothetical protein
MNLIVFCILDMWRRAGRQSDGVERARPRSRTLVSAPAPLAPTRKAANMARRDRAGAR